MTARTDAPLAPYLAPEAREVRLDALAAALGAEVVTFGHSVEGRPLRAARVPAHGEPGGPAGLPARILCVANIHGLEYVSAEVALGFLAALGAGPGLALRGRAAGESGTAGIANVGSATRAAGVEVWVAPCLNPDGYARTWEQAGQGRVRDLRPNARGVDLNRNFPLPHGARRWPWPGAGSTEPGSATYVGPEPLSEPETAALDRLLSELRPHALASLHCFMGILIPARVTDAPTYATYATLSQAFAAAQPGPRYGRLASRWLDTFTGELEDHAHHHHRTFAMCVETFPILASLRQHARAPSTFWRFNPRDPAPWVANDVPGLIAWFTAALGHARP